MNTINKKKKSNTLNTLNILSNPTFVLGSIINPIIPFNNTFQKDNDNNNNNKNNNNNNNKNNNNTNNNDNEDLNNKNKEKKPIDIFFGSIVDIEKPPSPIQNIDTIENSQNYLNESLQDTFKNETIDKSFQLNLKQIYPPINNNNNNSNSNNSNSSNSKLLSSKPNQIYTNIEIKEKIEKLSDNELCEIFKIIKNNNEKYSTNKNGIFVNISTLKKITINELCDFISFCENNNKFFNQEEQTRDIYRDIILDL
jgi:hypothetical protein